MPRSKHLPTDESTLPAELPADVPKVDGLRIVLEAVADQLGPGALLPSERVLAEHFEMARTTVRQTIDRLISDGVLFRRHGHGTFVASAPLIGVDMLSSFTVAMKARGVDPGATVLSSMVEPASAGLAGQLEVATGSRILRLVRIRTADQDRLAVERIAVSVDRFPGVEKLDWTDRSFHTEVAQRWGATVHRAENRVSAVLANLTVAEQLAIPAGSPCLLIEGRSRSQGGTVIEAGRSTYRGDLHHLIVQAQRD